MNKLYIINLNKLNFWNLKIKDFNKKCKYWKKFKFL